MDIDLDKLSNIPAIQKPENIFDFLKSIVFNTNDLCVSYKINTAFYESLGVDGIILMEKLAFYIKDNYPEIFLICDAKRADIGNTSSKYAKSYFGNLPFDAITLSPYMGVDSITPFFEYKDKWVIILALTSNEGHKDFQIIKSQNGLYIFEEVINKFNNINNKNIMFVVGATNSEYLKRIRKIDPNSFILVPGVGQQGGDMKKVCESGMNRDIGILINASRSIIYPKNGISKDNIRREALKLKSEMEYFL